MYCVSFPILRGFLPSGKMRVESRRPGAPLAFHSRGAAGVKKWSGALLLSEFVAKEHGHF